MIFGSEHMYTNDLQWYTCVHVIYIHGLSWCTGIIYSMMINGIVVCKIFMIMAGVFLQVIAYECCDHDYPVGRVSIADCCCCVYDYCDQDWLTYDQGVIMYGVSCTSELLK